MFREKRDYRAIMLTGRNFRDLLSFARWLPPEMFEQNDELDAFPGGTSGHHAFFFSAIPYVRSEEALNLIRVRRGKREVYRYDVYLLFYTRGSTPVCVVAAPFLRLNSEILTIVSERVRGDVTYQRVRLDELVASVVAGKHDGGRIKVRALEFDVRGDAEVDRLMFRGADTLNSKTYSRIIPALRGIELSPRACDVSYDDHQGSRFALEADRFGNFAFRVGADARNLPRINLILDYLVAQNLLTTTRIMPTRRDESALQ